MDTLRRWPSAPSYSIYYIIGLGLFILLLLFTFDLRLSQPQSSLPPTYSPSLHATRHISDKDAYEAIYRIAKQIKDGVEQNKCSFRKYGTGWGAHELCEVKPSNNCKFVSFGISSDYTFDTDMANTAKCKGLALDPTVNHPSKLHDNVWFLNMGATSLEQMPSSWIVTSVPALLKWVKWDYIDVLKMDCEGCEYAIARDVLTEDPAFFRTCWSVCI